MNTGPARLLCAVSVGNTRFTDELFHAYSAWATTRGVEIDVVVLDRAEEYNIAAFEAVSREVARELAEARGDACRTRAARAGLRCVDWSDVCARVDQDSWRADVETLYRQSRRFQQHCLNQTYHSLQPRFRAQGVQRKSDLLVQRCVPYLLEEVALKVGAFSSEYYGGEIMPVPESALMLAIYAGQYLRLPQRIAAFHLVAHDGNAVREDAVVGQGPHGNDAVARRRLATPPATKRPLSSPQG